MRIVIAATRSNEPEVHAADCADIKRGLRTGKYQSAHSYEVAEVEDGARIFWEDFLPGGCAYEESWYHEDAPDGERGMQDDDAQGYTRYLPCCYKR